MVALQVAENDVITSDQLPEPARVIKVMLDGAGTRIMAVGTNTNQFYDRIFQLGEVQVRRVTFAADGERFTTWASCSPGGQTRGGRPRLPVSIRSPKARLIAPT